jgi:subtilisin family serine protease
MVAAIRRRLAATVHSSTDTGDPIAGRGFAVRTRRFSIVIGLVAAFLAGTAASAGNHLAPGAAGRPAGAVAQDFTLKLAGYAFDPLEGEPALPEGWSHSAASGPDLHLVQFDGPIAKGALAALRDRGFEPVQYVHPNTYIVWGGRAARSGLTLGGAVRWTGDFAPAYRVQPQWRDLPADVVEFQALIYRGADPDGVIAAVAALGGAVTDRRVVNEKLEVAGIKLPGDRARYAAAIPGVYSLQLRADDAASRGEISAQISAGNVDGSNLALIGYPAWLTTLGLDGSGVTVGLVDEGIDQGHPDIVSRVQQCTGDSCDDRRAWHGTHIAGLIAGDAASAEVDANGFLRGLGVAPGTMLLEQAWRPTFEEPGGMLKLINESYANGAVISNNSWGTSTIARGYDIDTLLIDAGVRDADPLVPGNQPMIYIQAIHNGDGGVSSQGTPDDGKNIFSVGSTPVLITPDGTQTTAINDLSSNSAHGPALDGRTLPHIVAPGCYLDSTWWETPPDGFSYWLLCGTSMSAGHVSGAVALFVEYYRSLTSVDPSPALVKAAFMSVAHDLDGNLDADGVTMGHRPDSKQGWGRIDTAAVVDPSEPVLYFDQPTIFEFSGQEWSRVVTPANPAEPMRVMLVWTDAPGHGLGGATPALSNDLDLSVDAGGQTYLGNDLGANGFSTTGGSADTMNNAEAVFLQSVAGNATIRVAATNVNSNGVPNFGDDTDQDFALACYNCALEPGFALSTASTTVDICAPGDGELAIDVEALAGFGNPVTLAVSGVPAGAAASFSANPVTPTGTSVLTIDPGTVLDGDYGLQVDGDSATLNRSFSMEARIRTASPLPALPTAPADLGVDVALKPALTWNPVPWTDHYLVELSTDPTFQSIFYSAVEDATIHTPAHFLAENTVYHWRVRATNVCGYGSFSTVSSFTTMDHTDLLLVDDDYDLPNEQAEYTNELDALGVSYDVVEICQFPECTPVVFEPDLETLSPYDRVIWWSGAEEIYAGPDDDTETALGEWLDRGSCLLLSSIDYVLVQGGITTFMQERLGVDSVSEDTGMTLVTGQGAAFGGLGPFGLQNTNPDFRDSISPDATAELGFSGDLGDAGVSKDGGWYRTSFLGFGIESAAAGETRQILDAFLTWCDGLDAVDGDGDGIVNGDDCAPGDPGAWTGPSPATDLMLGKGAIGFSWSQPVSGSGSTYDVLRSGDPTEWYNSTCVVADTPQTFTVPDPEDPAPGELFFYLVGASSPCGRSTLGLNPDGTPRHGTACDPERTWWE